jgi:hypothetical protein
MQLNNVAKYMCAFMFPHSYPSALLVVDVSFESSSIYVTLSSSTSDKIMCIGVGHQCEGIHP